jgi:hypothetical protein
MRGCPPCLPDLALAAPYLRAIAASVAAAGADEQAWLARHGLAPDALSDTALELPLARFAALVVPGTA